MQPAARGIRGASVAGAGAGGAAAQRRALADEAAGPPRTWPATTVTMRDGARDEGGAAGTREAGREWLHAARAALPTPPPPPMLAAATRAAACRGVRHLASVGGDQMAAIKALRAASAAPIADVRSALVEAGWNQGV